MPPQRDVINRDDYYANMAYTVIPGSADLELDLEAILIAVGRHQLKSECGYVEIVTNVAIYVKLNRTTASLITCGTTTARIFDRVCKIKKLFFTYPIAGCAAGNATVKILAF